MILHFLLVKSCSNLFLIWNPFTENIEVASVLKSLYKMFIHCLGYYYAVYIMFGHRSSLNRGYIAD